MAKKKQKTSPIFYIVVIAVMAAIFVIQMLFPTNLGEVYNELAESAVEITVTVTAGGNDEENQVGSYYTDDLETMIAFGAWAEEKTMRNKSLADGLTADALRMTKYNFAIKNVDGSYQGLVIDEKGYVHTGAELYQLSDPAEEVIAELIWQLESWGKKE